MRGRDRPERDVVANDSDATAGGVRNEGTGGVMAIGPILADVRDAQAHAQCASAGVGAQC